MKQDGKLSTKKDIGNLLDAIKVCMVLLFVAYAIVAVIVCVITENFSWLFAFVYGAIPLVFLLMIPYYFAKIFAKMAQDISCLSQTTTDIYSKLNNNTSAASDIPLEPVSQNGENKE